MSFDYIPKDVSIKTGEISVNSDNGNAGVSKTDLPMGSVWSQPREDVKVQASTQNSESEQSKQESSQVQQLEQSTSPFQSQLFGNKFEMYAEKTGFNGSIEELIAQLRKRTDLNAEEQDLLKSYDEACKIQAAYSEKEEQIKKIIIDYTGVVLSNGSPSEKMEKAMELYLKDNPEYANLSDEDKAKYKNEKLQELFKMVVPKGAKLTAAQKKLSMVDVVMLLGVSKSRDISFEDLKNMSADDRKEILSSVKTELFNQVEENIPGFANMNSKDKLYAVAQCYFELTVPEFASKTEEQKQAYIQEKGAEFVSSILGIEIKDLDKFLNEFSANIDIIGIIKFLGSQNITPTQFLGMSPLEQNGLYLQFLNSKENISEDAKKQIDFLTARQGLIKAAVDFTGKSEVTDRDIYNELKKLKESGVELDEAQQKIFSIYENMEKAGLSLDKAANFESNFIKMALFGIEDDVDFLNMKLYELDPKKDRDNFIETLSQIVAVNEETDLDSNFINNVKGYLKRRGLSTEEINSILSECRINESRVAIRAAIEGNIDGLNQAQNNNMLHGSAEVKEQTGRVTQVVVSQMKKPEDISKFGENSAINGLSDNFNSGLEENNHITDQQRTNIVYNIANSDNLSPAQQAIYTQSAIRCAKTPQRQLNYGHRLSESSNASVIEGLAAASKSVDSSVRSEYNSYVTSAAKNFSTEDQARINQALNTGAISSKTLSQTQPVKTPQASAAAPTAKSSNAAMTSTPTVISEQEHADNNLTKYASLKIQKGASEEKIVNTYFEYLQDVTSKLEAKKDSLSERVEEARDSITEAVETTETKAVEKTYHGISEALMKELKDAYKTGGISELYKKLSKISSMAQRTFLAYFLQYATASEIRAFAEEFKDNMEVIAMICLYGDISLLPSDIIAKYLKKGTISASNISEISTFASNHRHDRKILEGLFAFTGDVSILALDYNLLTEYLAKDASVKSKLMEKPGIYSAYLASLPEYKQRELQGQFNNDRFASNDDLTDDYIEGNMFSNGNLSTRIESKRKEPPIPGSPEFYAQLNQQSDKYNPNNYFTGTLYDPERKKKLNNLS